MIATIHIYDDYACMESFHSLKLHSKKSSFDKEMNKSSDCSDLL